MELRFKPEFDWRKVAWGKPDSPQRALCSYCHGLLPDVPLMLFREDGACVSFCDTCLGQWVISEVA